MEYDSNTAGYECHAYAVKDKNVPSMRLASTSLKVRQIDTFILK